MDGLDFLQCGRWFRLQMSGDPGKEIRFLSVEMMPKPWWCLYICASENLNPIFWTWNQTWCSGVKKADVIVQWVSSSSVSCGSWEQILTDYWYTPGEILPQDIQICGHKLNPSGIITTIPTVILVGGCVCVPGKVVIPLHMLFNSLNNPYREIVYLCFIKTKQAWRGFLHPFNKCAVSRDYVHARL